MPGLRDIYSNTKAVSTIAPIVANNDTEGTGAAVDTRGYDSAKAIIHVGDSGDTLSGTVLWTLKLQHSDTTTPGDFVDVPTDQCQGTNGLVIDAPAEDTIVHEIGYLGTKRYLRVFADATGTHANGTPLSAVIELGHAHRKPVR